MFIWKYMLERRRVQTIRMPKGSKILSLQTQFAKPCLWIAFDRQNHDYYHRVEEARSFVTIGTGEDVPDTLSSLNFLGTYQIDNGAEVYHVFEQR